MHWPAVKKTPVLVKYLGCHCGCDMRRFMLWFNTHEWKCSENGMRPALTAESAGPRCQQVTLSLLSRPNVFDAASHPDAPQPTSSLSVSNRLASTKGCRAFPESDFAHCPMTGKTRNKAFDIAPHIRGQRRTQVLAAGREHRSARNSCLPGRNSSWGNTFG